MRVLCVTGSINQGGAEYQILALAQTLKSNGYEVSVLALTNYSYYLDYINKHKLGYKYIDNHGRKIMRLLRAIRAIQRSKPEIVIAYARLASLVAILSRVCSFGKFKLIISERTSLTRPKFDIFYFHLSILASAIIVNSIPKYNYVIKQFPFLKTRIRFIPNLIETERFSDIIRTVPLDCLTRLTYIGRLSPEKNLLNLIKAVRIILDKGYKVRLSLYGEAHNLQYLSEINNLADALKINDKIRYEGTTKGINDAYSKTDLICLVSAYEGFSNVLAEALVCGIPVITSDIPENKYLIEDGINGYLVNPHSITSIADGLEKFLLLSSEEKGGFYDRNRKKAKSILDRKVIVPKYLELLNR